MAEPLLALEDVRAGYGDAVVLDGISFDVAEQGSLAVLGRNGVGKSTLLLTIMGYTQLARGRIAWRGRRYHARGTAPARPRRPGLGGAGARNFPSLSVEENLTVAARPGRWDLTAVYACSRGLNERRATAAATIFPAASSRCWRSRGR